MVYVCTRKYGSIHKNLITKCSNVRYAYVTLPFRNISHHPQPRYIDGGNDRPLPRIHTEKKICRLFR